MHAWVPRVIALAWAFSFLGQNTPKIETAIFYSCRSIWRPFPNISTTLCVWCASIKALPVLSSSESWMWAFKCFGEKNAQGTTQQRTKSGGLAMCTLSRQSPIYARAEHPLLISITDNNTINSNAFSWLSLIAWLVLVCEWLSHWWLDLVNYRSSKMMITDSNSWRYPWLNKLSLKLVVLNCSSLNVLI